MPTHNKRALLRLNGLVTDDFPFDKRWSDDELALNVMEQLPLNLSMHRIRFVKGSYGVLTPINLANDLTLTGERLLRVVGQGCVYAQVVARNNVVGEATSTRSINDEDEIGTENIRSFTSQPPLSEQASYDAIENVRSDILPRSVSEETNYDVRETISDTLQPSQSRTTSSDDIYSTIRAIFPQVPFETLRACAVDNNEVESAIEAVLNREISLEQMVNEMKNKVDKENQITITVRRSSIWRDCLAFYNVALVDKSQLFKELKLEFEEEEGVKCGALCVEFFQLCVQEAKKALLEEVDKSFIPKKTSTTTSLLAFKVLGVLIGHSLIQDGVGLHNLLSITCGVPQGSVLGPLLFLIYVNDLPNASKKLTFYLFADDTNIYYESKDLFNLIKIVNKELRLVKKWLDANKLSLNIDKTNYIIFHSSSVNVPSGSDIKIGKKHIKRVKFVKFLGLLLDEHLSRKYHLSELSKKIARTCGMFFKIRNLLPLDVLFCLYNALFLPFLQYGLIVWGQTYASYIDPIFKLQKRAVRAISFQPLMSPSLPIFNDFKLLKLSEIFELQLLTFVFDSINKTSPSCFHDFFLLSSSVHQYSTRQASQGDLYMFKKNSLQYGLKSIRYHGVKLWNTLPLELRNAPTKIMFKTKLKIYSLNKVDR